MLFGKKTEKTRGSEPPSNIDQELEDLRTQIEKANLSPTVTAILMKEWERLTKNDPSNPEYAIGAVSLHDVYYDEESKHISPEYLHTETTRLKTELASRLKHFMSGRPLTNLKGKHVIIVDDGIATGRTLIACLKSIKKENPARVIIAAPVASSHAQAVLTPMVDEFVCPVVSSEFYAVGQFYENFPQVSDDEVKVLLAKVPNAPS